ncbi:hypothetical protein EMPS_04280 [Entomortierella parvispora]|uniref:Fe2OG dioxygenase domain-containing protein n=1 Tax=Entomortierella parvispora TaxID=205924 RepID=A0A9P3H8S8_9FUNG|nr:hypothetical protein EMPS_04280 [Entomortierella parvispora]
MSTFPHHHTQFSKSNNSNSNNNQNSNYSNKHRTDPESEDDTSLQHNDPDWDHKLATLFSIFENASVHTLHSALVSAKGDLEEAIPFILSNGSSTTTSGIKNPNTAMDTQQARKRQRLIQPRLSTFLHSPSTTSTLGQDSSSRQRSLHHSSLDSASLLYRSSTTANGEDDHSNSIHLPSVYDRLRWKDGVDESSSSTPRIKPLILYKPEDVAKNCPCTLIFNVLPKDLSNRLLKVMLEDSETWNRNRWWLFERMVESPHKTSYFADREDDLEEVAGWTYNGRKQDPPRQFLPEMNEAKMIVRDIVNDLRKSRTIHPYEVQGPWKCNVAAVNHYAHSKESVGWHADKLTYLGPRPTIGSLTLGATRFFRIRKVVPDAKNPDTASQMISIALPHNSLLVMWPPMQEEWKHEVPTQATVTPHPISGTARINITYRLRREGFSPQETPVCQCGVAMVLRCVFKNKANYGKYFYMCYAAGSQEGKTCGQFQWVDMEKKLGLAPPPSVASLSRSSSPSSLSYGTSNRQEGEQEEGNKVGGEEKVRGRVESRLSPENLDLIEELREDPALFDIPMDDDGLEEGDEEKEEQEQGRQQQRQ